MKKHYIYAACSEEEFLQIRQRARAWGLTVSNYVRRGINNLLLDSGDDPFFLEERLPGNTKRSADRLGR